MKHAWRNSIIDRANMNSESQVEIPLQDYREMYERDEEMSTSERQEGIEVVEV